MRFVLQAASDSPDVKKGKKILATFLIIGIGRDQKTRSESTE
jgi:hypothetical protein